MGSVVYAAWWRSHLSSPEELEKYCRACSAHVASAILLTTEIDAATLAGRSTNALVSEFSEISSRMLERSQSAELGIG